MREQRKQHDTSLHAQMLLNTLKFTIHYELSTIPSMSLKVLVCSCVWYVRLRAAGCRGREAEEDVSPIGVKCNYDCIEGRENDVSVAAGQ